MFKESKKNENQENKQNFKWDSYEIKNKYIQKEEKTALVTGASRGIGLALANAFAREGWNLVLTCDHTMNDMKQAAVQIQNQYPVKIECIQCDMGNSNAVQNLFQEIRNHSSLNLVINNAGIACVKLLQDMTDEEWNHIIAVNLSSVFYTCREAIPIFLAQESGYILNISSVFGENGASCEVAYSATKGAVNALTKALAKELAPSKIPVNAIACGCIDTTMNDNLSSEEKSALAEEIPAGRFGRPDEIAETAVHLVQLSPYLTGQIITIDGGWR